MVKDHAEIRMDEINTPAQGMLTIPGAGIMTDPFCEWRLVRDMDRWDKIIYCDVKCKRFMIYSE
jgi:hypothetical protein